MTHPQGQGVSGRDCSIQSVRKGRAEMGPVGVSIESPTLDGTRGVQMEGGSREVRSEGSVLEVEFRQSPGEGSEGRF